VVEYWLQARAGANAGLGPGKQATKVQGCAAMRDGNGWSVAAVRRAPQWCHCVRVRFVLVLLLVGAVCKPAAGEDKLGGELLAWANAQGAGVDKVTLQSGDDGLSLIATADIAADSEVFTVPAALLFPTSVSPASPVPSMLQNASIGRISAICLYLMAEKHLPDSYWQPWIRTLPERYHHALSYTDEDMSHFQASPFKELRSRKHVNIEREYRETVTPLLAKLAPKTNEGVQADKGAEPAAGGAAETANLTVADFSLKDFVWAYSVVTTRGIFPGLLGDSESEGDVPLVVVGPVTDSLAHGEGSIRLSYDAEKKVSLCLQKLQL
jgi:hypothetical protein